MTTPGHTAYRMAAALAVALLPFGAAPADVAAQENVTVRTEGLGNGWLGLRVFEQVGVDRAGPFSAIIVSQVMDDGPAARAGLRAGDRVVRVNGRPATPALFNRLASSLAPGQTMRLTVDRDDGEPRQLVMTAASPPDNITLELSPEIAARVDSSLRRLDSLRVALLRSDSVRVRGRLVGDPAGQAPALIRSRARAQGRTAAAGGEELGGRARPASGAVPADSRPLLPWLEGRSWVGGARLTVVDANLAPYFGVEGGLLVTEVIEDTPLPAAGLRPGDVIVSAGDRPVRSLDELRALLGRTGVGGIVLSVVRRGETVEVRLER